MKRGDLVRLKSNVRMSTRKGSVQAPDCVFVVTKDCGGSSWYDCNIAPACSCCALHYLREVGTQYSYLDLIWAA